MVRDPATLDVAIDGNAIFFVGKESGDLGRGKVGWLGNISDEIA